MVDPEIANSEGTQRPAANGDVDPCGSRLRAARHLPVIDEYPEDVRIAGAVGRASVGRTPRWIADDDVDIGMRPSVNSDVLVMAGSDAAIESRREECRGAGRDTDRCESCRERKRSTDREPLKSGHGGSPLR